ncbi:MAG: hypothetical protein LC754_06435 [Acidobacteria bacterium]|nr:hypothetical protein [Acidobacteriota bacterium]
MRGTLPPLISNDLLGCCPSEKRRMTKQQYWEAHVKRNPKFADEDFAIQMKVGMLRKLLEEAYDKGMEHSKKTNDVMKDLFKGVDLNQFRTK